LTIIPFLAAIPMLIKKVKGIEITRAQGQETIRNTKERLNQIAASAPNKVGIRNTKNAAATTAGV